MRDSDSTPLVFRDLKLDLWHLAIHRTYSVNCRSILWLMICLTSARGRLLNVSIAINRPIL